LIHFYKRKLTAHSLAMASDYCQVRGDGEKEEEMLNIKVKWEKMIACWQNLLDFRKRLEGQLEDVTEELDDMGSLEGLGKTGATVHKYRDQVLEAVQSYLKRLQVPVALPRPPVRCTDWVGDRVPQLLDQMNQQKLQIKKIQDQNSKAAQKFYKMNRDGQKLLDKLAKFEKEVAWLEDEEEKLRACSVDIKPDRELVRLSIMLRCLAITSNLDNCLDVYWKEGKMTNTSTALDISMYLHGPAQ